MTRTSWGSRVDNVERRWTALNVLGGTVLGHRRARYSLKDKLDPVAHGRDVDAPVKDYLLHIVRTIVGAYYPKLLQWVPVSCVFERVRIGRQFYGSVCQSSQQCV